MGKISSKNGLILIGGYNLSTYAANYEIAYNTGAVEVTGFTDGWQNYIPGLQSGEMTLNMYWDSAANTSNVALQTLPLQCVTIVPEGGTVGKDCFVMYGQANNWKPAAEPGAALMVGSPTFVASGVDAGPLRAQLLQYATITDTTSSTGVDDPAGAGATQRCIGVLHVFTPPAADTYSIAIEHADTQGGAYTTVMTFTANGSTRTSEWKTTASGAIKRWRRVTATRTGAAGNNFGFAVSFWHAGM